MVPDRCTVLLLAAKADCTPRTARRALTEGVSGIQGGNLRDRLRAGARELGVRLPGDTRAPESGAA